MEGKHTQFITYIKTRACSTSCKMNAGLSLIEIMVAILLFSLTVLAVTRLYWVALTSNHNAILNNLGQLRAQSLIERLLIDSEHPTVELKRWQTINKKLLPQSKYQVLNYPIHDFELSWFDNMRHQRHTIKVKIQ